MNCQNNLKFGHLLSTHRANRALMVLATKVLMNVCKFSPAQMAKGFNTQMDTFFMFF